MEHEILKLEEAVRTAQLNHDDDFFENLLADDFEFITPQGKIVTKREDIEQYRSGTLRMKQVEIEDRSINIYGTTAVVRFVAKFDGKSGDYSFSTKLRFTRVYSKVSDKWTMVAGHSSTLS